MFKFLGRWFSSLGMWFEGFWFERKKRRAYIPPASVTQDYVTKPLSRKQLKARRQEELASQSRHEQYVHNKIS
jgi:response regulator RpfG family c-di-GMP phosphodiesterase